MSEVVQPLLTITEAARDMILDALSRESEPESLALWVEVSGVSAGAYTYVMEFRPFDDVGEADVVQRHDDLPIVIMAGSVDKLAGATLNLSGSGMVMQNPNQPAPPAAWGADRPEPDLSDPVAQHVMAILAEQINPSIASHGGRADLVAVEDSVAYLRLSGGCQGCGMASVTLSQGIEVAILDNVPEISQVVDVTDHASGANPFYEAAKK